MSIPNPGNWDVCDVDHGISFPVYDGMRWVVNALYYALKAVETVYNFVELFLGWISLELPSGVVIKLVEGGTIPDFRWKNKKFWAIKFYWFGYFETITPLPKYSWNPDFISWWTQLTNLPGSENWSFRDPSDNTIKHGHDISPVRKYNLFGDGFRDVIPVAFILMIVYLLLKLGLPKAVPKFISFLGHVSTSINIKQIEDSIEEMRLKIDLIDGKIGSVITGDSLLLELQANRNLLNDIKTVIGVRLTL
jgi:hypothetical protein